MLARIGDAVGKIADHRGSTFLTAAAVTVLFGCFSFFGDMAMQQFGVDAELHASAQATLVGIGAGLTTLLILLARKQRRDAVRSELARLTELNHRLRNLLEIVVGANYLRSDDPQKKLIFETVCAMDTTLKQLFPAFERRKPVSHLPAVSTPRPERRA